MRFRTACAAGLAAAIASLACASAASAKGDDGRDFLTKAIEGDNSEMTLGALAERKGASAETKAYGRTLHTDHQKARAQAVAVARKLHVSAPTRMMPEAAKEQRKLQGLSGQAFDHEFGRYMVEDHTKDIQDFQKAAASDNPQVAELAKATLPVLEKHLHMAQALDRNTGR